MKVDIYGIYTEIRCNSTVGIDDKLLASERKSSGYSFLRFFQFSKSYFRYRIINCSFIYICICFCSTYIGVSKNFFNGCKRCVMIKQKSSCSMPSGVKGNIFFPTKKLFINSFNNPITHSIGWHMEKFSSGSMK